MSRSHLLHTFSLCRELLDDSFPQNYANFSEETSLFCRREVSISWSSRLSRSTFLRSFWILLNTLQACLYLTYRSFSYDLNLLYSCSRLSIKSWDFFIICGSKFLLKAMLSLLIGLFPEAPVEFLTPLFCYRRDVCCTVVALWSVLRILGSYSRFDG